MYLTVANTLEKIKNDNLPFWKLFLVNKFNDKLTPFAEYNKGDIDGSINCLSKQIEYVRPDDSIKLKIEARQNITSNGDAIKEWYFISGPTNIKEEIIERIATSIYNRELAVDRLLEVESIVLKEIYKDAATTN